MNIGDTTAVCSGYKKLLGIKIAGRLTFKLHLDNIIEKKNSLLYIKFFTLLYINALYKIIPNVDASKKCFSLNSFFLMWFEGFAVQSDITFCQWSQGAFQSFRNKLPCWRVLLEQFRWKSKISRWCSFQIKPSFHRNLNFHQVLNLSIKFDIYLILFEAAVLIFLNKI